MSTSEECVGTAGVQAIAGLATLLRLGDGGTRTGGRRRKCSGLWACRWPLKVLSFALRQERFGVQGGYPTTRHVWVLGPARKVEPQEEYGMHIGPKAIVL